MRVRGVLAGIAILATPFLFSPSTLADIGVGVGTGKITIDETLVAGGIYTLPAIPVYNTGDETATYAMQLTLNETQDQLKPDPDWFSFSPASFELEPGEAQVVTPTLSPPIQVAAGEYFGYLEAYPDATVDSDGGAAIGVAAATKLTFTMQSSSSLQSILTRIAALYMRYTPWTYFVSAFIILFALLYVLRKYIKLDISVSKKKKAKDTENEE